MRQREDDVEVRNGQQVGAARGEPPFLGQRLTLRAVPIATGVVGDPHGAAAVTRLPMPAEDGGAAGRDRPERHVLDRREAVRPTIRVAVRPHDVRELQPRTRRARPPCPSARRTRGQLCGGGANRASRSSGESGAHLRVPRQLQVARRRADVAVPEQPLNRVEVDAGFEQVRRKRVPQPVNPAGLRDARAQLRDADTPVAARSDRIGCGRSRRRKQPRAAGARAFQ